jgi:hypothetical protein
MQRRRSVSYKFERNILAEKAKLEAQLANLDALLAFLNEARPTIDILRQGIRQLDAVGIRQSLSSPDLQPPKCNAAGYPHRNDRTGGPD